VLRVLGGSAGLARSFVADASGIGTTMLIARDCNLEPHFSGHSAAEHAASGATPLLSGNVGEVAEARRDVDTEADLVDAYRLGLGSATRSLFDPTRTHLGRYLPVTVTAEPTGDGWTVITAAGTRAWLPVSALGGPLRQVRPGQRLHAVLAGREVLSAWL